MRNVGEAVRRIVGKAAKKAREVVTPERCSECGAIFSWRDLAYGAWNHGACKRCRDRALSSGLAFVRYVRMEPRNKPNRKARRSFMHGKPEAAPKHRHATVCRASRREAARVAALVKKYPALAA